MIDSARRLSNDLACHFGDFDAAQLGCAASLHDPLLEYESEFLFWVVRGRKNCAQARCARIRQFRRCDGRAARLTDGLQQPTL